MIVLGLAIDALTSTDVKQESPNELATAQDLNMLLGLMSTS
jgi:hypothetical protein